MADLKAGDYVKYNNHYGKVISISGIYIIAKRIPTRPLTDVLYKEDVKKISREEITAELI